MHLRRFAISAAIACLALGAGAAFAAIALDLSDPEDVIPPALLITTYALVAMGCAALLSRRIAVLPALATLIISGVSLPGWLTLIWFNDSFRNDTLTMLFDLVTSTTLIGVLSLIVALLHIPSLRTTAARSIRTGTIATGTVLISLAILPSWVPSLIPRSALEPLTASALILTAAGGILVPLLWWRERAGAVGDDGALARRVPVEIACPRCEERQTLPANRTVHCRNCRTRLRVSVEEPRCECGYLLYRLAAPRCPECGRRIALRDSWRPSLSPPSPDSPAASS